VLILAANS